MRGALIYCCIAALLCGGQLEHAAAQPVSEDDNSRGVRLLDTAPTPPPALPEFTPAPPPLSPPSAAPSAPSLTAPPTAALPATPAEPQPAAPVYQPNPEPAAVKQEPPEPTLSGTAPSAYTQPGAPSVAAPAMLPEQVDVAETVRQLPNAAGLSLGIVPSDTIPVGERLTIRVASKKAGYLILVDIDASGRLTQIFPNPRSLLTMRRSPNSANQIRPGHAISIPDSTNPFAGFQFVATPPTGTALLVALLSNRPVQVLDLPDVPPSLVGQAAALTYVRDMARRLKIAQLNGTMEEIDWSFDAKFYAVR